MKREFTNEELNILDEGIFDITCIYSRIALMRQAIIGGDIISKKDIARALYVIEYQLEDTIGNIDSALGSNHLEKQ